MVAVNKSRVQFLVYVATLVLSSNSFASASDAEACSREELLQEECDYENAIQKRDCLREQIAKFKECERKRKELDQQLVDALEKKGEIEKNQLRR